MQPLNAITHPLSGTSLIEASAGTGKTYTMAALYLRLLLNAGENAFGRALGVEQILVMTFTEAATQELKDRIRARVVELLDLLKSWQQTSEFASADPFLCALFDAISGDVDEAILRLDMAQQNMDAAAIFTIHGFCRRMLSRYAFDANLHFDPVLLDERAQQERYLKHCRQAWRARFYPQSAVVCAFARQFLKSPDAVLDHIKHFLEGSLPAKSVSTFAEITAELEAYAAARDELKNLWQASQSAVRELLANAIATKQLNGKTYSASSLESKCTALNAWLEGALSFTLPKELDYFSQNQLTNKTNKNQTTPTHAFFTAVDAFNARINTTRFEQLHKALLWHMALDVRQRLNEESAHNNEMSFGDLLSRLSDALQSSQGAHLAQLIRMQFPFAMVDEFQDTDSQQFQILQKIYLEASEHSVGLIMIGDPKQSIYRFRSADIYTYLAAKQQTAREFTLGKNWRSSESAVALVNQLFSQLDDAFLVPEIHFSPVQAGGGKTALYLNGDAQTALCVCLAQADNKTAFRQSQARACAASVQRYLQAIEAGKLWGENQRGEHLPLAASDLAILVRKGDEAMEVKAALQALGIKSVYLSNKDNVFQSPWAQVLLQVLQGCLMPYERTKVINALASQLFYFDSQTLNHLLYDEQRWDSWVEQLLNWQQMWFNQGVLPMIHAILQHGQVAQTILAHADGERAMTDILHLSELLQTQMNQQPNAYALLTWFEQQIALKGAGGEALSLRLESEQDLVKIVTIHGSKGLEYGVVWLPFVGAGANLAPKTLEKFHNGGQSDVDFDNSALEHIIREQAAEEMRLLYVALTRAVYQVHLGLYAEFYQGQAIQNNKWGWNPLVYLLTQGELGLDLAQRPTFNTPALLAKHFTPEQYTLTHCDALTPSDWRAQPDAVDGEAAHFYGQIEKDWVINSFTSLSQQSAVNPLHEVLQEPESGQGDVELALVQSAVNVDDIAFTFPAGARVGEVLHHLLQRMDMRIDADNRTLIENALSALGLEASGFDALQAWLARIVQTPLCEDNAFCLQAIELRDSVREMEFLLAINSKVHANVFNQLLARYPLKTARERFALSDFKGMLRGFIDLVCRHAGQYYIVDYKSNFLGANQASYTPDRLTQAVLAHNYDLQYLLYTLALHRYLKTRVPNYDYARDFGGVYYLFLRGMTGQSNATGVYFDKPHFALIEALDKVFGQ
ncbi:exodeoxyribonuclease V subunit beta [Pasteurellaceae bacterium TAE3-ERU1]|nr:exodeoxyribonuclease V subunit beta [Pasteurellaceae bacterium TAE3-ERU1]